jgi:sugar/nucleoside kinase (ribokinase family)
MVTPDAEKTMCTSLGIGALLAAGDIDTGAITAADVLYVEGYLVGAGPTDEAVEVAVTAVRAAGTRVALSLSDPAWVELRGRELDALLDRVDILFANEQEACGLTGRSDAASAAAVLHERCPMVAVTRGALGSAFAGGPDLIVVPAAAGAQVVDTTGAGDSFAAGFLSGLVRGAGPENCARLGALAAAEVVSHLGARPQQSLAALASAAGLMG